MISKFIIKEQVPNKRQANQMAKIKRKFWRIVTKWKEDLGRKNRKVKAVVKMEVQTDLNIHNCKFDST